MLSLEDCIAFSELSREEIDAIAEHEHLPLIVAAELGCYMLHLPKGADAIKMIMLDDIRDAIHARDFAHSARLKMALRHFVQDHAG